MKISKLSLLLALCLPVVSFAQEADITLPELKPLPEVRISMQRMLRSTEGRYFLDLYAGIWNPHGTLTDLQEPKQINFKGTQKADFIDLNSVHVGTEQSAATAYRLAGTLNANTGSFKAELMEKTVPPSTSYLQFEPAFKAADKPILLFKFYGVQSADQPYGKSLKRVDVINKSNGEVLQSLQGFNAFGNSMGFLDVNFDGYYDVVLSDTSDGRKIEDKRFIYWMYNPKTKNFQRSPQLEKIVGFPKLKGELQQIDFGSGQIFRVDQGLLYPVSE